MRARTDTALEKMQQSVESPSASQQLTRRLDLSENGLLGFVRRQHPLVRTVLDAMENAEPWAADQNWEAVDALIELGQRLSPDDYHLLGSAPPPDLVRLLGMISMTRTLMLVDRIGQDGHVDDVEFLSLCREAARGDADCEMAFRVVFSRLMHLTRRRLLHRIYSPKRAHAISRALRTIPLI